MTDPNRSLKSLARVSVPTVFFYFPTREALVMAVLDDVARFLTDMAVTIHSALSGGSVYC